MTENIDDSETFTIGINGIKTMKKYITMFFAPDTTQMNYIINHIDGCECGLERAPFIVTIKQSKPEFKALTYRALDCMYPEYPEWAEVNTHEDWYLHSMYGTTSDYRVRYCGSHYQGNFHHMYPKFTNNSSPSDLTNNGWPQYFADEIVVQRLQNYPMFDGFHLDNAYLMHFAEERIADQHASPNCSDTANTLNTCQLDTGSGSLYNTYYPVASWVSCGSSSTLNPIHWMYKQCLLIRKQMNDAGLSNKILNGNSFLQFNLSTAYPTGPGMGLESENFLTGPDNPSCPENFYGDDAMHLSYMNQAEAGLSAHPGVMWMPSGSIGEPNPAMAYPCNVQQQGVYGWGTIQEQLDHVHYWGVSFYCRTCMVLHDPAYTYIAFQNRYGTPYILPSYPTFWVDEFDTPIGDPVETKVPVLVDGNGYGVYKREFEHAIIAYNAHCTSHNNVTIPGVSGTHNFNHREGKIFPI